jgi:chromosome segregation ATPase
LTPCRCFLRIPTQDHRLQQLSSERGPITAHIEGLERHITTMYEELVEEFDQKKDKEAVMELKDQKIALLAQELSKVRRAGKFNEQFIVSLEECVKVLYKRYVRGEKVTESNSKSREALQDKIKEYMHRDDEGSAVSSEINDRKSSGLVLSDGLLGYVLPVCSSSMYVQMASIPGMLAVTTRKD